MAANSRSPTGPWWQGRGRHRCRPGRSRSWTTRSCCSDAPRLAPRMSGVGSLMLLDTASLYYRAFFGVPETVKAPDGTPVNAIRGFLDMVATLVTQRRPGRLVACWDDDWRPAFRVAALPSYKAHRVANPALGTEETPPGLEPQVPVIADV